MIEIIRRIFGANEFSSQEFASNFLFSHTDAALGKANFWLVVTATDLHEIIEQQPELFNLCKLNCSHKAMEKNLSMLILWDTNGKLDIRDLKKSIMSIEEDIYFFKKHVLYCSELEVADLKTELADEDVNKFFQRKIISKEVFKHYKNDPLKQSWQSLLYRVAIKLSFMNLNINRSDGLTSLIKNNELAIAKSAAPNLANFDKRFFSLLDDRKRSITESEPGDLLAEWKFLLQDDKS